VFVDTLDTEDSVESTRVFIDQSQYINGLVDDVYKAKVVNPSNAQSRAQMWGKSLQQFNDAGMYSANRNGMYRWDMSPFIEDHCTDCLRLNGQVHRLKTFKARGLMPKSSRLKCWGAHCGCKLTRTTETARGRF
jgi:hypothetical protein